MSSYVFSNSATPARCDRIAVRSPTQSASCRAPIRLRLLVRSCALGAHRDTPARFRLARFFGLGRQVHRQAPGAQGLREQVLEQVPEEYGEGAADGFGSTLAAEQVASDRGV